MATLANRCVIAAVFPLFFLSCALNTRHAALPPKQQEELVDPNAITSTSHRFSDNVDHGANNKVNLVSNSDTHKPINILAISGGGFYGAFDVGVLNGMSESDNRPVFDVVTGISTGAFIAPFAFLGSKYDEFLKTSYLDLTTDQIYREKSLLIGVFTQSLASSSPLKRKIDAAVTPALLDEIATAHRQGRRLYIGTTNLETRRLIVWDMGAIAASGKPGSLELFRNVVLASGSVPGFFPPVSIDVEVAGKKYTEMHVDGGTTCSVFVRPYMLGANSKQPNTRTGSNVFVISSGKLFADAAQVNSSFFDITSNAITALLYAGTRSDLNQIYGLAVENGMNYRLAAVPTQLTLNGDSFTVDPNDMKALYQSGYAIGQSPSSWKTKPPDAKVKDIDLPRTGSELELRSSH